MRIQTFNLTKIYNKGKDNEVNAIKEASIRINDNDFFILTGPSGSGKTTLLSLLGLLTRPTRGKILYQDEEVTSYSDSWRTRVRREKVGFIFQQYNLLQQFQAWENVSLPLLCHNVSMMERKQRATQIMSELGLGKRIGFKVSNLSGGEQQRVAIARALITDPEVIFADEPTASIDEETANLIIDLFKFLKKNGKTMVISTHDRSLMKEKTGQVHLENGTALIH